jgi:hypothetical protein
MRLPAWFGESHPQLAAAGLYHTMQTLSAAQDATGSISVRDELLERFGHTYFAARVREQSATSP